MSKVTKATWCLIVILCPLVMVSAGEIPLGQSGFNPAMGAGGGVIHLVYTGTNRAVYYMRSGNGGAGWEGPWMVPGSEDVDARIGRPAVAGDGNGNAHITWSNGMNAAFYQRFENGAFAGKQTAIVSGTVVEPDIAVDSQGTAHIVAMVNDGSWFIGHSRNPGGNWEGVQQVSEKFHDAHIGAPSIAADAVGSCHLVWKQEDAGTHPHYMRLDVATNTWTDHTTLGPSGGAGDVFVSATSGGFPRVAWAEYKNSGGWYIYGIMVCRKDETGWHNDGKISPGGYITEGGAPTVPRIVTDGMNRTYVSWVCADRLHLAVHDSAQNRWIIPDLLVTPSGRQYNHGACADADAAYWCYEDSRGGLYLSWGSAGDPPGPLQGDINSDGRVNGADLVLLGLAFGATSGGDRWNPAADLDGSGVIDGNDLAILGGNFGRG